MRKYKYNRLALFQVCVVLFLWRQCGYTYKIYIANLKFKRSVETPSSKSYSNVGCLGVEDKL